MKFSTENITFLEKFEHIIHEIYKKKKEIVRKIAQFEFFVGFGPHVSCSNDTYIYYYWDRCACSCNRLSIRLFFQNSLYTRGEVYTPPISSADYIQEAPQLLVPGQRIHINVHKLD